MHPYLIEQLAREHRRELRSAARQRIRAVPRRRRGPRRSARHRAGWALIELGLRLAGPASDA